jgi:hypothetical protein
MKAMDLIGMAMYSSTTLRLEPTIDTHTSVTHYTFSSDNPILAQNTSKDTKMASRDLG